MDKLPPSERPIAIVKPLPKEDTKQTANTSYQPQLSRQGAHPQVGEKRLPQRVVQAGPLEKVETLSDAGTFLWETLNLRPLPDVQVEGRVAYPIDIYDIGEPGDVLAHVCSRPDIHSFLPFWGIVYQNDIPAIVNINPEGMSGDYFPDTSHSLTCGDLSVVRRPKGKEKGKSIEPIKLMVKRRGGVGKTVRFYKVADWPDGRGYPSPKKLIKFARKLLGLLRPPLIHCQAGLGRTGTLVMAMNLVSLNSSNLLLQDNCVEKTRKTDFTGKGGARRRSLCLFS